MTMRRTDRFLVTVTVLSLLAAAASVKGSASRTMAHERTQHQASGCTVAATKQLVQAFVANFNHGRVDAAVRAWAPAPRFQWYSTTRPGKRLGSASKDRSTLASYFRSRTRMHERIRLTEFGAGYDPKRKIVNFGGKLIRSADDASDTPTPRDFKGAADCRTGDPRLIVWSTA
jgi:hypothetical protein